MHQTQYLPNQVWNHPFPIIIIIIQKSSRIFTTSSVHDTLIKRPSNKSFLLLHQLRNKEVTCTEVISIFHIEWRRRNRGKETVLFPNPVSSPDTSITRGGWKGDSFSMVSPFSFLRKLTPPRRERLGRAPKTGGVATRRKRSRHLGAPPWSGWYCTCSRRPSRQLANRFPVQARISRHGRKVTD